MKLYCPNLNCKERLSPNPNEGLIVRNGSYYRACDSKRIARYFCKSCKKHFSRATLKPCYRQKRRRITPLLWQLISSGVSQRRAAKILHADRKTIVRRFRFLKVRARKEQEKLLKRYRDNPLSVIQFDDLETSEHTKCKPVSVSLAIDPINRKILSFKVSPMPAKGHLVKLAFRKYGYRRDERAKGWDSMMRELVPYVKEDATFHSDENPHYPKHLKRHFPHSTHVQVKGGRGCIAGQGELKKLRYDPIFALNHTCAMLRANLNRLFRKTWCTTKNLQGLEDHLTLFVTYFNRELTA